MVSPWLARFLWSALKCRFAVMIGEWPRLHMGLLGRAACPAIIFDAHLPSCKRRVFSLESINGHKWNHRACMHLFMHAGISRQHSHVRARRHMLADLYHDSLCCRVHCRYTCPYTDKYIIFSSFFIY